jgi:hypothetical protein
VRQLCRRGVQIATWRPDFVVFIVQKLIMQKFIEQKRVAQLREHYIAQQLPRSSGGVPGGQLGSCFTEFCRGFAAWRAP